MTTYIKSKILQNPATPCLPLLIIYILAILPFTLKFLFNTSFITLFLWIPVYFIYKFKSIPLKHLLILFASGLFSTFFFCFSTDNHISTLTNAGKTYLSIKGTVRNVHYPNKILQWNAKTPQYIVKIREISLKNSIIQCEGTIITSHLKDKLAYGDTLELTGRLIPIHSSPHSGGLSFESYYRQRNISHILYVDEAKFLKSATGLTSLWKTFYEFRDQIIHKATSGLKNPQHRRIVASIFFGYKGVLETTERDVFQKSGTAHLFAVSGLHVGIAASFFLLFFKLFRISNRNIPFYLLPSLLLYVIMTGAPPSAVRAFIMFSVWIIARSSLRPSTGLNNLAVSALIILILNPLDLYSLGFLYTFVITTSLVMGYEKSLAFFKSLNEKNSWKGNFNQQIPFLHKAATLLFCSMTASLSSWGLNILFNQQAIPFAFITNFFSSLIAWCTFMTAVFSLTGLSIFYAIQDIFIDSLLYLVEIGDIYWATQSATVFLVILYYVCFYLCLTSPNYIKVFATSFVLTFIAISLPQAQNRISLFLHSSSNIPTIKIHFEDRTYLINATSWAASRELINKNIHAIYFSEPKASHSWALEYFADLASPQLICTQDRHISYLKRKFPQHSDIINSHSLESIRTIFTKKENGYIYEFADHLPGNEHLTIKIQNQKHGNCYVSIQLKDFEKRIALQHRNSSTEMHFTLPDI